MTEDLRQLADLIRARNASDRGIARIIGRPAPMGHIGEFVAAQVFDIAPEEAADHKGADGHFRSGPLAGRTVIVKFRPPGTTARWTSTPPPRPLGSSCWRGRISAPPVQTALSARSR